MEIYPGPKALSVLSQSGLLSRDLPIEPDDVLRFLKLADSYALICYQDGVPEGYVVCCKRMMEQQTTELFILQAVGDGGMRWVTEGWSCVHELAKRLGCVRIGTMLPMLAAPGLCRRFGLVPQGVFATTPVRGGKSH
jgi:hypothetical protein